MISQYSLSLSLSLTHTHTHTHTHTQHIRPQGQTRNAQKRDKSTDGHVAEHRYRSLVRRQMHTYTYIHTKKQNTHTNTHTHTHTHKRTDRDTFLYSYHTPTSLYKQKQLAKHITDKKSFSPVCFAFKQTFSRISFQETWHV